MTFQPGQRVQWEDGPIIFGEGEAVPYLRNGVVVGPMPADPSYICVNGEAHPLNVVVVAARRLTALPPDDPSAVKDWTATRDYFADHPAELFDRRGDEEEL